MSSKSVFLPKSKRKYSIKDMHRHARGVGGRCLSSEYLGNKEKLKWQCKHKHPVWMASPVNVLVNRSWCPTCAGRGKTIKDMQALAKRHDPPGVCLSKKYSGNKVKLWWRCGNGHTKWDASPASVATGSWCPTCADRPRKTIKDMHQLARSKKPSGWCLSKKYVSTHAKLKWKCHYGHIWLARPSKIQSGQWCPDCGGKKKSSIEDMRKTGRKMGGWCLSDEYINDSSPLKWKCGACAHEWFATPSNIKRGKWCPQCGIMKRAAAQKGTLHDCQDVAKSRGGLCLSESYVSTHTNLEWQCKAGHTWQAAPANIKRGTWCPHCHINYGEEIVRLYFEKTFHAKFPRSWPEFLKISKLAVRELDGYSSDLKIAFEHHGRQHYEHVSRFHKTANALIAIKAKDKARIRLCKEHGVKLVIIPSVPDMLDIDKLPAFLEMEFRKKDISFVSVPINLDINKVYANTPIDMLQKKAKEFGGRLLSAYYLGNHQPLDWRCKKGHEWQASPARIKAGTWCTSCSGKRRKTVEDMKALAESKGLLFLSKRYVNAHASYKWRCSEGHIFWARPGRIRAYIRCRRCELPK